MRWQTSAFDELHPGPAGDARIQHLNSVRDHGRAQLTSQYQPGEFAMRFMKNLCLLAVAAGICGAAQPINLTADGFGADVYFSRPPGAEPRFVYIAVFEDATQSRSSRETNAYAYLTDCTASGFNGQFYEMFTCVSGFGIVPAAAFTKRGSQAATFDADLATLPEVSLSKYVIKLGEKTDLEKPASYRISFSLRANQLFSSVDHLVSRQSSPGASLVRTGQFSNESADVSGMVTGEILPGIGYLMQYRTVTVNVFR
jgi:hypothetical protein